MSVNHPTPGAPLPRKQTKWLRVAGISVLLLGLATAAAVYRIRTHAGPTEDELMAGSDRAESYQMERLYGKMGLLTHKLSDDLKQPGIQAGIIAAASILIALGCFYAARLSEEDDQAR